MQHGQAARVCAGGTCAGPRLNLCGRTSPGAKARRTSHLDGDLLGGELHVGGLRGLGGVVQVGGRAGRQHAARRQGGHDAVLGVLHLGPRQAQDGLRARDLRTRAHNRDGTQRHAWSLCSRVSAHGRPRTLKRAADLSQGQQRALLQVDGAEPDAVVLARRRQHGAARAEGQARDGRRVQPAPPRHLCTTHGVRGVRAWREGGAREGCGAC